MNFSVLEKVSFWKSRRLPVVLQSEAAECGLACLCMIAGYWGYKTDLTTLRRRFSVSMKGTTMVGIIAMARGCALRSRALKMEMDGLRELALPCILHWNFNHFVVLKSIGPGHATIHDPVIGVRRIALAEFAKSFTGVALELSPSAEFAPGKDVQRYSLASLMGRVIGLKRGFAQLLVFGAALQLCALVAPFYLQWVVDEALLTGDRDLITVLGVGFLLLVVLQASLAAVRSWVTVVLSTNLNFQWLGNAFAHLLKLPLPYFEKRHTGDIVSRFGSIMTVQRSLTTQFVEAVIDGMLVVCTLAMMFLYSPLLSAVACGAALVYFLMRCVIYGHLKGATAEQIVHAARQQTNFLESIQGIQSIRLFGRGEVRHATWLNALADQFNAELRVARIAVTYQTANGFLFNVERVLVVWLAALAVLDKNMSVGMMFAFISYKDQFSQRIASLVDKFFEFRMLSLHGERIADIVLATPEEDVVPFEIASEEIVPSFEFRDVTFRYSDAEPPVIRGLNLVVPAGQSVAITGGSGSGKTTLTKLLLGLLEPTGGEIFIGGKKVASLGISNYRRLLGTVMQDDTLFAGSIADNISFFHTEPDMGRVRHCARLAAIEDEIQAMPMAFNTIIGDIGTGLSGGQSQRVLLARALYSQPKILVLDEATSHLDIKNERAVNEAIRSIALTRVIVAHRPETIAMAQRVVVLENGAIVQDYCQEEAAGALAEVRPRQFA